MKIERPNAKTLSPQEVAQLQILQSTVEKALDDGQFSITEIEQIKAIMWADGKVTYEELRTVRNTIHSVMGDVPPEYEWRSFG